jgi:hypothetical protein
LLAEKLDGAPTDTLPPMTAVDEELAQIQSLLRGAKQCVGNRLGSSLEDDGSVLALQPRTHAGGKLGHRHRIGGAFVLDELMVQLGE